MADLWDHNDGTRPHHHLALPHLEPANFSNAIEIVGAVMISCAVLVVLCRTYVRCLRKRTAGWDDACILLAVVSLLKCLRQVVALTI